MAAPIGFILLTHAAPGQIQRLVRRLNRLFASPPIVCHHDFSKCSLAADEFPPNVKFVCPHIQTGWAQFNVVEANVNAFRLMYANGDGPEWVVMLSGADYPIKNGQQILQDLQSGQWDAHIHHELIAPKRLKRDWQRQCHLRYFLQPIRIPRVVHKLVRLPNRLVKWFVPFSDNFQCYAGSQWFSASRRAACYLVEWRDRQTSFTEYCRRISHFSEEVYFQTVLGNSALRLHNENYRYTDWVAGGSHPKTLGLEDLPKLVSSHCHFARKVSSTDPALLDQVDKIVDGTA